MWIVHHKEMSYKYHVCDSLEVSANIGTGVMDVLAPLKPLLVVSDIPTLASLVGLATHIPLNIALTYNLGRGYIGAAAVTIACQTIQLLVILLYWFGSRRGMERILRQMGGIGVGRTQWSFGKKSRWHYSH